MQAVGSLTKRARRDFHGIVTQIVTAGRPDSVPFGSTAVTDIKCLPGANTRGGVVAVIPFIIPLAPSGTGTVINLNAFVGPPEMS